MGGVSGHAGLFGSARAVYTMVKGWQDALRGEGFVEPEMANRFIMRYRENRLSRDLVWGGIGPRLSVRLQVVFSHGQALAIWGIRARRSGRIQHRNWL